MGSLTTATWRALLTIRTALWTTCMLRGWTLSCPRSWHQKCPPATCPGQVGCRMSPRPSAAGLHVRQAASNLQRPGTARMRALCGGNDSSAHFIAHSLSAVTLTVLQVSNALLKDASGNAEYDFMAAVKEKNTAQRLHVRWQSTRIPAGCSAPAQHDAERAVG